MSLVKQQVASLANQVISGFLQQGTFPTTQAVVAGIKKILDTPIGTPTSAFTPIPYGIQSSTAINTLVSSIATDTQLLYDVVVAQVNALIADFDYKETKRTRLAHRMSTISKQLSGPIPQIDFSKSTAFYNFRTDTIELPPASNQTARIDLSSATITSTAPSGAQVTGVLQNIVGDLLNEVYAARISTSQASQSLTVTITPTIPQTCSRAVLVGHVASSTQVVLVINGQQLATQTLDISKQAEWNFAPVGVSSFQIVLSKQAPDTAISGQNIFDFGIQSFGAYTQTYIPAAVFTTEPFALESSELTLAVDQEIPPNCDINWAVSIDSGTYLPIEPGVPLTIASPSVGDSTRVFPLTSVRDSIRVFQTTADIQGIQVDTGTLVETQIRGASTQLFELCSVSAQTTMGNSKVYRGRNAWKVRAYHYSIDREDTVQNPPPAIQDMISPRGSQVYTRYQPAEFDLANQYSSLSSEEEVAIRLPALEQPIRNTSDRVMTSYEATLTVDAGLSPNTLSGLKATLISLPIIFANNGAAIYCNGKQLTVLANTTGQGLSYQVVLPLMSGANTLQIITNVASTLQGGAFDVGTSVFSGLCAYGGQITWYADPGPMTEVSLFELQYQTARNDFSRYALAQSSSGGNMLVVRELPTCVYDVATTIWPQDNHQVTLQAGLSGSQVTPQLTPVIHSYRIG